MTENLVTILPNAASLIESMRSIGYSFETAIADIIDNSISAGAKSINIYQREQSGEPYLQVIDDGRGMDDYELIEAMRLGSKNPINKRKSNDLGRFGLGLKSASFSQCKVLTVISKKNEKIVGYRWDLDLVHQTDKFNVIKLSTGTLENIPNLAELKSKESGTIIQWEIFDRIANSTSNLTSELIDLMNIAVEHIALIFHRFIASGLNITVNFEPVVAKDPYLVDHNGTQELKNKKVVIDDEIIFVQSYVLPHYSNLSANDKRKAGKSDEQYNGQGFYLYRNKRLIVWGDYLGLTRKTELGKNLRIRVDIPNSLDYLWEIDVKKSRAKVPSIIKKNLFSAINDGEIVSKNVNTYRGKKELKKDKPIWDLYTDRDQKFHLEINPENKLYQHFLSLLDEEQKNVFFTFEKAMAVNVPFQAIYSQISEGNESYNDNSQQIIEQLQETIKILQTSQVFDINSWLKSILSEEPYSSSQAAIEFINKEMGGNNV